MIRRRCSSSGRPRCGVLCRIGVMLACLVSCTAAQEADSISNSTDEVLGGYLNATESDNLMHESWQQYSLIFTLDGPSGDGLMREPSQVQDLVWFMQNVTYSFVPEFQTEEQVRNVTTVCSYLKQNSFDLQLNLPPYTSPATLTEAPQPPTLAPSSSSSGRRLQEQGTTFNDLLLFANTTYEYIYTMNYSSREVNVENYTDYYQRSIYALTPVLQLQLREWLNVPDTSVLTIQGVFTSFDDALDEAEEAIAPTLNETALMEELKKYENVTVNTSQTSQNITDLTFAPTTLTPTSIPTISPAPTTTYSPTNTPSIATPSPAPSEVPTQYPTFLTNSSSRGRYDFTFTVSGPQDPQSMFLNDEEFCDLMKSLTPVIAPPPQNPDLVETTCPSIDGGWSRIDRTRPPSIAVALAPAISPAPTGLLVTDDDIVWPIPPTDENGTMYFGNTSSAMEEPTNGTATDGDNVTATASRTAGRFLRGSSDKGSNRQLQSVGAVGTNGTAMINGTIVWKYTVVMRWTSSAFDVSSYPDRLEEYVNENTQFVEDNLEVKLNATSDNNVTFASFVLINDRTNAPSPRPTLAPSDFPTADESLPPTYYPTYRPTISLNPSSILNGTNGTVLPPLSNGTDGEDQITQSPSTEEMTFAPTMEEDPPADHAVVISVVVIVIVLALIAIVFLFRFYRQRRDKMIKMQNESAMAASRRASQSNNSENQDHFLVSTTATASPSTQGWVPDLSDISEKDNTVDKYRLSNDLTVATNGSAKSHDFSKASSLSKSSSQASHASKASSHGSNGSDAINKPVNGQSLAAPAAAAVASGATRKKSLRKPPSSLLSDIEEDPYASVDDFGDDERTTDDTATSNSPPLDAFEQYKDHNLERMRSKVEDNVEGIDGMMSQAMTRALIMESTSTSTSKDASPWHGASTGVEIEADALWEVTDWLRRHESSVREDEKQEYMQDLLNKMVTAVRRGSLGPEVGSRAIHECAALLGLKLANQLNVNTILLMGMQKTTNVTDVVKTFRNFGPIDDAAVAPGQRGFGFVRFKNPKHVHDAMHRFRTAEVVVKDVAITLKEVK